MEIKVQIKGEVSTYYYSPEHFKDVLAFYENAYYKGRIDNLWVNGIAFEEAL